jgi:transitional endoplasmic reticulum ATPase
MTGEDPSKLKLKVTEALSKDVGRALARLGPEDIERLDAAIGDIVIVGGKRKTVCKVMPAYKALRGQSRVQLDGITRDNAGVGLDEPVEIQKAPFRPAGRVVLSPINLAPGARDLGYIRGLLDGLPVVEGDRVRAALFGSRPADFKVEKTAPPGPVLISPSTMLSIGKKREDDTTHAVSYEDIGGLKHQLQRIREMIELPLRYPEVFNRLGIEPPKGVLLHGPPGCGKTLIARTIAHETDANFFR